MVFKHFWPVLSIRLHLPLDFLVSCGTIIPLFKPFIAFSYMVHLSFKQYCQLIELRLQSEVMLSRMEVVPVPDPRLFARVDVMRLFTEVLDGMINRYRGR